MKEYLKPFDEVIDGVKSGLSGLSSAEASRRLEENGKNKLAEGKKDSLLKRFLSQLADPMIIILIVAAVISAVTATFGGEGEGYADVVIIMVVVIINAVLGVYQESKAEKAIEALQEIAAATSKVIRDGKLLDVRSEDLVVGDIVVLEAGDSVPADCRIIENASLKIEEAALTGESVPVDKTTDVVDTEGSDDVPLGDRKNMCYMGSNVVYGRGKAVVVAAGMDTEMGKIADALTQAKDEETPLQMKLNQLSKILSILVLGICVFIFAFSIVRTILAGDKVTFDNTLSFFMVAVSLAVAAIPEGLAAVVTIVLSIGVTKMSKRNAVIRKLTAVETLGCTQIICSDKTGTLTQNKMTVVEYRGDDETLLATAMALCCDAALQEDGSIKGEPTEAALVAYADKLGLKKYELEAKSPRVGEAPFDSGRKMMSTVHETPNGFVQYTKGAPDVVLSRCTTVLKDGKRVPMTEELRESIAAQNKEMADQALRVLCAAMRVHWEQPSNDAAALEQEHDFDQIVITRPTVVLGNQDIGFLPGDKDRKMSPFMQPVMDNIGVIKEKFRPSGKEALKIQRLMDEGKIVIEPLAFIRGRSLGRSFFIIDEAQNLTPHEVKTIITRAAEGTKVVFTGDIFQIDQPYLDMWSNGLTHLSDKMDGQKLFEHVSLRKGERSELSELAAKLL